MEESKRNLSGLTQEIGLNCSSLNGFKPIAAFNPIGLYQPFCTET
jgi:hypothetical protein